MTQWKKQALEALPDAFSVRRDRVAADEEALKAQLYQQIGQLKVELDWLKKKLARSSEEKRLLIEPEHKSLSLSRQCQLVGLPRASFYYQPQPESEENLRLMRLLDEQYTQTPFYGIRRMTAWLQKQGSQVNHKRVARLLRLMGLEAIYPKPRLSQPGVGQQIYPYLLRGLKTDFCTSALQQALVQATPEIFNTDQGVQFTSQAFTGILKEQKIAISMDGRGRALDNIFVERLWRSVKYEEVCLYDYEGVPQAITGLGKYFAFYSHERPHQSLNYKTPAAVYHRQPA